MNLIGRIRIRTIFRCFILLIWLPICVGCKQEEKSTDSPIQVTFACEQEGIMVDAEAAPPEVYALIDDFKVKLAEWTSCSVLSREDFPAGLPKETIAAVRGEDYVLWAEHTEEGVSFYTARYKELTQSDFSCIATYQQHLFELLRPLHPADLAGYYTYAGADTSYVLFVGIEGDHLINKLFATTEALPTAKMLQRMLPTFAATDELPLYYDLNTLSFYGPLGQGYLYWQKETVQLRFGTFLGQEREIHFDLLKY